jgi:hypothetical protein
MALGLGAVALATIYCRPILEHISNWGIQDWDYFNFQQEVARQTIIEYRELPLWNSYACGGLPLLAHPLSRLITPFFLLYLLFGVPLAIRLEIVFHLALAFLGAFLFASTLGVRRLGSLVAGSLYAFSSYFAVNLMTGMTVFLSAAYLPFLGWLLVRNGSQREMVWGIALCLALIFGEGGHYNVPICALLLITLSIAWDHKQVIQLPTIGALAIGLSAVKLFPAVELMSKYPRQISDYSGYRIDSLLYSLLSRDQSVDAGFVHGLIYGMDENGIYIGILGLSLVAVGVLAQWRSRWRLLAVFGIFVWLSLGNRIWPSLWSFLHHLPVYDSMRAAQRFRVVCLLWLALFAGIGVHVVGDFITRRCRRPLYGTILEFAILAVLIVDLFAVGLGPWRDAFPIAAPVIEPGLEFRQARTGSFYDSQGPTSKMQQHSSWSGYLPDYYANLGTIDCYEPLPVHPAALPFDAPGYQGEVYAIGAAGSAEIIQRTPNSFRIRAELGSDGAVVINQNYYRGWWTSAGEIIDQHGLMAVKLSKGMHDFSLRFLPITFLLGALVTLVTIGYGIFLLCKSRLPSFLLRVRRGGARLTA